MPAPPHTHTHTHKEFSSMYIQIKSRKPHAATGDDRHIRQEKRLIHWAIVFVLTFGFMRILGFKVFAAAVAWVRAFSPDAKS